MFRLALRGVTCPEFPSVWQYLLQDQSSRPPGISEAFLHTEGFHRAQGPHAHPLASRMRKARRLLLGLSHSCPVRTAVITLHSMPLLVYRLSMCVVAEAWLFPVHASCKSPGHGHRHTGFGPVAFPAYRLEFC